MMSSNEKCTEKKIMQLTECRILYIYGENIVKRYATKTVLNGVNINIRKKSIYGLLSKNDEGKSVLLRCLIGMTKLDGGSIRIYNNPNNNSDQNKDLDSITNVTDPTLETNNCRIPGPNLGFAPQYFDIPSPFRIDELLRFISTLNNISKDFLDEQYRSMAAMLGLPTTGSLQIADLRYSQKKLLSLVLALIHEPELVVLDDITAGIDTITLKNMWALISRMNKSRGCTIVISSSNNLNYMESSVTHVGILQSGIIILEGSADDVMTFYGTPTIDKMLQAVLCPTNRQSEPSTALSRLPSVIQSTLETSSMLKEQKSLFDSVYFTHLTSCENRESTGIIRALVTMHVTVLAILNWTTILSFTCLMLAPLAFRLAYGSFPKYLKIAVQIQNPFDELVTCDEFKHSLQFDATKMISCVFVEKFLSSVFHPVYITEENYGFGDGFNCLLRFQHNYSLSLNRRITRQIESSVDWDNSLMTVTILTMDGQKALYLKKKIIHYYSEFISFYTKEVNESDLTFNSVMLQLYGYSKKNLTYGCYVNIGLFVTLSFYIHASLATKLILTDGEPALADLYYMYKISKWKQYIARLIIQITLSVIWSILMVGYLHAMNDLGHFNRTTTIIVFIVLFLESLCGILYGCQHLSSNLSIFPATVNIIHLFTGHILCAFIKTMFRVHAILYLTFLTLIYLSGVIWPTWELDKGMEWDQVVNSYLPVASGISYVRCVVEKMYIKMGAMYIVVFWILMLKFVTMLNIYFDEKNKGTIYY